jgi:small-conductance mechanosensitive channel
MGVGIVNQATWWWTAALVFGFPLLMLLLGELIFRLDRKQNPIVAPLKILRNFILPTLALFILLLYVMGLPRTETIVRIAETLFWIALTYGALTFLNVFLFKEAKPGTWQANVPDIFLDLSRTFLILVGLAVIFSNVWGADLGGLLTALGVGSLVIGLALQDSLGNIFSGIALLFERPVSIGDWVEIGDTVGKVVEINWRSVHLQTWSRDLVVVPNSELAKASFRNFNRPTLTHVENFEIGFSYDDPPNKVKKVLLETALATPGVLHDPPPWIAIYSYADFSVNYRIGIALPSYEKGLAIRNEFILRIWYAAKRYGLTIPYPISTEVQAELPASTFIPTPEMRQQKMLETLRAAPGISLVEMKLLESLNYEKLAHQFAKGEVMLEEGDLLPGMFMILEGTVELSLKDLSGTRQVIAQLLPGDYFGEKASLMSEQVSEVTAIALEDVEVLLLDQDTLQDMLERSPVFANEIGEVMELRRRTVASILNAA